MYFCDLLCQWKECWRVLQWKTFSHIWKRETGERKGLTGTLQDILWRGRLKRRCANTALAFTAVLNLITLIKWHTTCDPNCKSFTTKRVSTVFIAPLNARSVHQSSVFYWLPKHYFGNGRFTCGSRSFAAVFLLPRYGRIRTDKDMKF